MAVGDELLIVLEHPGHRDALRRLFEEAGYVCTAVGELEAAKELLAKKFFPAVVVDLDVGVPSSGLELVRFARDTSHATEFVVVTGRKSFEAAVEAMRLGVDELVEKRPDVAKELLVSVERACERFRAEADGGALLLREVNEVLDEAFRVMLDMGRKIYTREIATESTVISRNRVLLVDGDAASLASLGEAARTVDWQVIVEMTGGAAFERVSRAPIDLVIVRAELPDLPGSMVVRTVQDTRRDAVGIVFDRLGPGGRAELFRAGRSEHEAAIGDAAALVALGEGALTELRATARERRIIQAIRSEHGAFFRRYAELKRRLSRI